MQAWTNERDGKHGQMCRSRCRQMRVSMSVRAGCLFFSFIRNCFSFVVMYNIELLIHVLKGDLAFNICFIA